MTELTLPIIGYMHSPYKEKFGIPRQPNLVQVESYIEMTGPYNDLLAFEGIEEFSHLWLVWQFHDNKNQQSQQFRPQVRPPRLGGNKKIGVFATRSMYRPAPIGLSVVKLNRVEKVGKNVRVYVTGSDLLDGTPIIDIKPYIQYSDAVIEAQSGYAQDEPQRKSVIWTEEAEQQKQQFMSKGKVSPQILQELEKVLSLDPRPAYQDDEQRVYGMKFADLDVRFLVRELSVYISEIEYTEL
ncbi:tRNA (N6-threonylcarbamoyladenosine(37)-N6)-methyltransferase TrmO [Acinetobacter indicus]|uniref:tRNA (N6-threonylcarbamoyladenosine(37)-N6)-methyltransferase TrmO n=1 Tax=Acinetobacter indicus TaxID=756892 RepID=UPI000CEC07C0|nr:tRNA (N6-threonylcarbamoyladenosine(37)-N6)-methyltransferase TrmO [Acinetobacter indicus]MDV4312998.1 tRNA (N6-threonylcarbamoyladenosine(37)-N6)-methyltransferase TrmO [Acinetobacter indicus]QIZ62157.1 tRNA (N6-threonylcarbamoyladenosine(37)-N6)-methyltransferase TrmO [Acinetobacter indicus]